MIVRLLVAIALVLGAAAVVCAQTPDSVAAVEPYVLRIGYVPDALDRAGLTLPLTLASSPQPLGSYRVLIAFNADLVGIDAVLPWGGSDSAANPWREFSYDLRIDPRRVGDAPSGFLTISAARDSVLLSEQPVIDTLAFIACAPARTDLPEPVSLAFYWLTEDDNIITDIGGFSYCYLAAYDPAGLQLPEESLPGLTGTAVPALIQAIEFHSGGFALAEPLAVDTVRAYSTGDFNGDGAPWEAFDAIVFAALMVDDCGFYRAPCDSLPDSIRALADLDGDGLPLGLSDLATLLTLVIGDIKSQPATTGPFKCTLSRDTRAFSVDTPAPLGALLLTFEGEVAPWSIRPELSLTAHFRNGQTRVLIHRGLKGEPMNSGPLISVEPPAAVLLSVEAVAVQGRPGSVSLPD
jgi:hypothetical protein